MKVLLLLHGEFGGEKSIEYSFDELVQQNYIDSSDVFYYQSYLKENGWEKTQVQILELVKNLKPDLIFLLHIGNTPVNQKFFDRMKSFNSDVKLVYDEGDVYGGWAKPVTSSMKIAIKNADFVSIRGLGTWAKEISKWNKSIIYTPHCASISYLYQEFKPSTQRKKRIIFIGNCINSKLGYLRRLPGSLGRERMVKYICKEFQGKFDVYGKGWGKLISAKGQLPFGDQIRIANENWFHFAYEHYPDVSYYYSDRLPIALLAGQIYVCHYHNGYENIFKDCKFIFFYKTKQEAKQILLSLMEKNDSELANLSLQAHNFAKEKMLPFTVWRKTLLEIKGLIKSKKQILK